MGKLILFLGGARGGKSRAAEELARKLGGESVLFVATASAGDEEMRQRIQAHQKARPAGWRTHEAGRDLAASLAGIELPAVVLVDCITLLAANVLLTFPEDDYPQAEVNQAILDEVEPLLAMARRSASTWIVVSNEVGMGLVPPYPSGRAYRDGLGLANQRLAAAADQVILMIAGLPWELKPVSLS